MEGRNGRSRTVDRPKAAKEDGDVLRQTAMEQRNSVDSRGRSKHVGAIGDRFPDHVTALQQVTDIRCSLTIPVPRPALRPLPNDDKPVPDFVVISTTFVGLIGRLSHLKILEE